MIRAVEASEAPFAELAPLLLARAAMLLSQGWPLGMLRMVARRGRKRWLSLAFVSQQPGHLPQEVFELCNTRVVHNLRSQSNLDALRSTAGDVAQSLWDHCPLLGPGEALVSSPQLKRAVVARIRHASSRRKFTR